MSGKREGEINDVEGGGRKEGEKEKGLHDATGTFLAIRGNNIGVTWERGSADPIRWPVIYDSRWNIEPLNHTFTWQKAFA